MTIGSLPMDAAVRRADAAHRRRRSAARRRLAALGGLLPMTALVLLITLGPRSAVAAASAAVVAVVDRLGGPSGWTPGTAEVQMLANTVLFVPLGALLALSTRPRWWLLALPAGPAVSVAVELAQRWIPGRVPDAADVATNTTGAAVGFALGMAAVGTAALLGLIGRAVRPRAAAAR